MPSEASSKFSKRLARDIYLSNDIGRDANVDPFVNRDITKIFGDPRKLDRGATTLSFADKPLPRHSASPVSMQRGTSRTASAAGARGPTVCEGDYNPKRPDSRLSVSFTKDAPLGNGPTA